MIQFDEHIIQMGWFNHQLVSHFVLEVKPCFSIAPGTGVFGGKFDEALVAWFFGNSLSAVWGLVKEIWLQKINLTSNQPTRLHDM